MKEVAISVAVQKLSDLFIQKVNFLKGVKGQVAWLKDELQRMQSFLKDASEREPNDERIRMWISEVRQLAEHAETVIQKFTLKIDSPRGNTGLLTKCAIFPKRVYCLHRTGQAIKSIQRKLKDIDVSRERFGIHSLDEAAGVVSSKMIISDDEPPRQVVGGVEEVYNNRAGVKMQQEEVLQMLEPGEDSHRGKLVEILEKFSQQHTNRVVCDRLHGRRYLIMVDDDANLANAFPIEREFDKVASPALASLTRKRSAVDASPSLQIKKKKKSTLTSTAKEVASFGTYLSTVSEDKLQSYFKNLMSSASSSNSEIPLDFPAVALLDVIRAELTKPFPVDANLLDYLQNSLTRLLASQIPPATHNIFQQMLFAIDRIDLHLRPYMENLNSSRAHLSRLSELQNQQISILQEFNSVVEKEQVALVKRRRLTTHKNELHRKLTRLQTKLSETQTKLMTLKNDLIEHKDAKYSLYSQATSLDTELKPLLQRKTTFERHVTIGEKVLQDLETEWNRVKELSAEAEASLLDGTYKDNADPTVLDSLIVLAEQDFAHPDPPT